MSWRALSQAPGDNFAADLAKAIDQLNGTDEKLATTGAATLAVLARQADANDPLILATVPRLTSLIATAVGALQATASIALLMNVQMSSPCAELAMREGAMQAAVDMMGSPHGGGLRHNGAVLAGALIASDATGPAKFFNANGLDALAALLACDLDSSLVMVAADDVCKLAAVSEARPTLIDAGMLQALARLFGAVSQPETQLRGLMASAMLLGDSLPRLRALAEAPGAAAGLAAVMRTSKDRDALAIATRIFVSMVSFAPDEPSPSLVPLDILPAHWRAEHKFAGDSKQRPFVQAHNEETKPILELALRNTNKT